MSVVNDFFYKMRRGNGESATSFAARYKTSASRMEKVLETEMHREATLAFEAEVRKHREAMWQYHLEANNHEAEVRVIAGRRQALQAILRRLDATPRRG